VKFLILGASGQLGAELSKIFPEAMRTYSSTEVPSGVKVDLEDYHRVEDLILKTRPSVVINASAFTDVDGCERQRERAMAINAEAVRHIVRGSSVVDAYLVHISTDYVFEGEKGNYGETDLPNPINYYGLTKLLGEASLSYNDSLAVRTSGVFRHKGFPVYVYKALKVGKCWPIMGTTPPYQRGCWLRSYVS